VRARESERARERESEIPVDQQLPLLAKFAKPSLKIGSDLSLECACGRARIRKKERQRVCVCGLERKKMGERERVCVCMCV